MSEIQSTKICSCCKISQSINNFYPRKDKNGEPNLVISTCKTCEKQKQREWHKVHPKYVTHYRHRVGICRPMMDAKDCSSYLGVYVAERALSKFFDNIQRMPPNNPGYDFLCGGGHKIDVKSSCLRHYRGHPGWYFYIKRNQIADYFLCLAFDNRENLNPLHVWLLPAVLVNKKMSKLISDVPWVLAKWAQYEYPLDRVIACCTQIRESGSTQTLGASGL